MRLGLDYVGCELNPDYVALSRKRIGRTAADAGFGTGTAAPEDDRASQLGLWAT